MPRVLFWISLGDLGRGSHLLILHTAMRDRLCWLAKCWARPDMVGDALICVETEKTIFGKTPDRRKRQRLALRWPLKLWRGQEPAINTHTANVSADGFYCLSSAPFSPGDVVTALLQISGIPRDLVYDSLVIRCEVVVVRTEELANTDAHGVACRIVKYSVLQNAAGTSDIPSLVGMPQPLQNAKEVKILS